MKKNCSCRRESLVDAAYALIAERGMGGVRTRDIAARAGIHHATLHYYFPTKEDLIQAVADRLDEEFLASSSPPDHLEMAVRPVFEQLQYMLDRTEEQLRSKPERFLVGSELLLHARRDPAIMALLRRRRDWQSRLTELLEEGVRRGELRADLDILATVYCLMSFCMGLSMLSTKYPDSVKSAINQFVSMLSLLRG